MYVSLSIAQGMNIRCYNTIVAKRSCLVLQTVFRQEEIGLVQILTRKKIE